MPPFAQGTCRVEGEKAVQRCAFSWFEVATQRQL